MPITTFTSYDEIRAVLGVSSDELEDTTLALGVYSHSLLADLEGIDSALPSEFEAVAAIVEASRTAAQQRFYGAVKLFAPYAVAVQLASSLPLFAPKSLTDGKAGMSRDANSPHKLTIQKCQENFDRFRALLDQRYAALSDSDTPTPLRPFLAVVTPATDVVTNE